MRSAMMSRTRPPADAERGEIYAERFKHNLTDSNEDE
jgi:hypothetical protein